MRIASAAFTGRGSGGGRAKGSRTSVYSCNAAGRVPADFDTDSTRTACTIMRSVFENNGWHVVSVRVLSSPECGSTHGAPGSG